MTLDAAILAAVVAFLLPLRLLSLALRLAVSGRGSSTGALRRSCAALALTAALLAVIFALPRDHARECAAPAGGRDELRTEVEQLKLQLSRLESLWDNLKALDDKGHVLEEKDDRVIRALGLDIQSLIDTQVRDELRAEVEQLKLQLARLESLGDNSKALDEKGDPLEDKDGRVVRALGLDIQSLIDAQENIKELLRSSYDDRIKAMENEVEILKDESRKINSSIYNVQSLAKDTTERVEALHSDIKKVQVITDEWGAMNSNINRMWSFAKDTEKRVEGIYSDLKKSTEKRVEGIYSDLKKSTEKRVEGIYSDLKKGFKRTKRKMPFWTD